MKKIYICDKCGHIITLHTDRESLKDGLKIKKCTKCKSKVKEHKDDK